MVEESDHERGRKLPGFAGKIFQIEYMLQWIWMPSRMRETSAKHHFRCRRSSGTKVALYCLCKVEHELVFFSKLFQSLDNCHGKRSFAIPKAGLGLFSTRAGG